LKLPRGVRIDLKVFDAVVCVFVDLKLIFSESEVAGNKATGQVTRERRKSLSSWHAGPLKYSSTTERGFMRIASASPEKSGFIGGGRAGYNWQ
jgi:hypothetical protein